MARAEVQLALDASLFRRGIALAESSLMRFGGVARRIGGLATGALGGIGIAVSAAGIALGTKRVLDLGDSLSEMRQQTGIAVKDLVLLQEVFKDASLGAEDVGTSIGRMQKAIASGDKAFEGLGLKTKRLLDLGPAEQFSQIGRAIASIENPTKRAAMAMEIFGKSGAKLIPVFEAGIGSSKQLEWQAAALDRNAEAFGRVADKMKNVGLATRGFFIGVAEQALPMIERVLDRFDKVNWEEKGKSFARGLEGAIGVVQKVKEKLELMPLLGAAIGINALRKTKQTFEEMKGVTNVPIPSRMPKMPLAPLAYLTPKPDSKFWKQPDPRLQFGANTGPLQNFVSKVDPFLSPSEAAKVQQDEFFKRFPQARRDQAFTNRFGPGTPEALEAWGEKMGVRHGESRMDKPYKSGGYDLIRRGDAAREKALREGAQPPGGKEKVEASIKSADMDTMATKVKDGLAGLLPG